MTPHPLLRKVLHITSFVCLVASSVSLLSPNAKAGFVDVNLYPELTDVNVDSVATVNIFSKLPARWHYFSLTNFINTDADDSLSTDFKIYTEQNLRWAVWENLPFDFTTQLNLRAGEDTERLRFGMRWRFNHTNGLQQFFDAIHLAYSIDFHLLQLDHVDADVWQMEHVFRKTFPNLTDRLYLAGFIDHTFNEDLPANYPSNPIVAEVQLGCRLTGNWHAIAEYRINEYRRSDTSNLAMGVEYIFRW